MSNTYDVYYEILKENTNNDNYFCTHKYKNNFYKNMIDDKKEIFCSQKYFSDIKRK